MPIPNVSSLYKRINKGAEGGHEFARFIKLLLSAEFGSQGKNFISESDASGDYKGIDGYVQNDERFREVITGFQFKFYPSKLSDNHKNEIKASIEKAIFANKFLEKFILITPEDWQILEQKWFDNLKIKYEYKAWVEIEGYFKNLHLELVHWGHTKLIELSLKHDHIGHQYFPELFLIGVGNFKLSKASIDSKLCSWNAFPNSLNTYILTEDKSSSKTGDPVFDFHFKNSTPNIHLLNSVEIHIEDSWSKLNGIRSTYLLKSIGVHEHKMDYSKKINIIDLPDPINFKANSPKRFHIQLKDFIKSSPGNCIKIKFWFYFDDIAIHSDSILLSF